MNAYVIADTPDRIRLFALLGLRARLHLTVTTGMPWNIPASRGLRAWFGPAERIPHRRAAQLAWLEDRIEAEYGPLHNRYTPRPADARP